MLKIYQSKNFIVEATQHPHIDRDEGGHIKITPSIRVPDRQHLSSELAIELMRLTIVAGEAFTKVMNEHGVDIARINYQDNGNWGVFDEDGPYLHIHLYGRAKSAKIQKYGQALYLPHKNSHPEFYANSKPLKEEDIKDIKDEIEKLFKEERYSDNNWGYKN